MGLTREQVMEMEADREMDALILRAIFNVKPTGIFVPEWSEQPDDYYWIPSGKPRRTHMIDAQPVPSFSTNIQHAWQVYEWLKKKAGILMLEGYEVKEPRLRYMLWSLDESYSGDTPMIVICRAALIASLRRNQDEKEITARTE